MYLGPVGQRLLHQLVKAAAGEYAEEREGQVGHQVAHAAQPACVLPHLSEGANRRSLAPPLVVKQIDLSLLIIIASTLVVCRGKCEACHAINNQ
eukprot:scaffold264703_cov50-Prasinocladus_malaysianus.AAC.2